MAKSNTLFFILYKNIFGDTACIKANVNLLKGPYHALDKLVVVDGKRIAINTDALACDPALVSDNHSEDNWIVDYDHTGDYEILNKDILDLVNTESTKPEYFIKVQAQIVSGQQPVGKTNDAINDIDSSIPVPSASNAPVFLPHQW
ncbi:hypothetical protein BGZ49_005678 [Haplosporangium sp. Z 27]|nr:hypothetical protein BGZ49_005678 [Haplosporangium sp. Z 27]